MKVKIIPGSFSKNSCPLVLNVLDAETKPCGFAYYQQRVGDYLIYTFNGQQFKINFGALHAKNTIRDH